MPEHILASAFSSNSENAKRRDSMSRDSRADKYRRNAQGYFSQSGKRDELLKGELEKGRIAEKEKIARLRALRLERDTGAPDQENSEEAPNL
jgi:hypothetical protein